MKKLFAMLMALLMVGSVTGCTKTDTPNDDQLPGDENLDTGEVYEVTAAGYGGDMKVKVTFEGDDITKVEVVEHAETDGVGTLAIDELPGKIAELDDYEVDVVTGATMTSEAIKDAVRQAVDQKYGFGSEGESGYIADTKVEMALESTLAGSEWPAFMYVETTDLEGITGVSADQIVEHVFAMPMMAVHATSFIVIEAKDADALADVTEKMGTYFKGVEEQWSTYLPDQHELVQNRVEKTVGNYYIGIIAADAETLAETLEGYLTVEAK